MGALIILIVIILFFLGLGMMTDKPEKKAIDKRIINWYTYKDRNPYAKRSKDAY